MDRRFYGTPLGERDSRFATSRRGESHADEGTLILQTSSLGYEVVSPRGSNPELMRTGATRSAAPSVPPAFASMRPRLESWTEDRGNWALPTARPSQATLHAPPAPSSGLATAAIGAIALLATLGAVIAALNDGDARSTQAVESEAPAAVVALGAQPFAAPQAVVAPPPAAPVAIAPTTAQAGALPTAAYAGASAVPGASAPNTLIANAPANAPASAPIASAPTANAPIANASITSAAAAPAPAKRAKAPAPANPAKTWTSKPSGGTQAERQLLESLLEKQLAL